MLPDETIDRAADQLAEYRKNDVLTDILDQYADLIEKYKRLKSDYEEEREGRERYKQLARGQERNPFALVVVDGDGYVFDDQYVGTGEEGGSRAAKHLIDAVKTSLRRKGLESCEVMVRVYANLVGLSKSLCKNGLCGAEKRSLSSFTAGFNRSYGLADFIDAGELKENADFKLKAILRMYADNAQCKHIYFAACHDVGYVSDLTPYRGNRDRFTLIRTPSLRFHREFDKLGMAVEELPGVFRQTPLTYTYSAQAQAKNISASSSATKFGSITNHSTNRGSVSNDGNTVCTFYTNGKCRYGSGCRYAHIDTKTSSTHTSQSSTPSPPSISNGSRLDRNINSDWRRGSSSSITRPNIDNIDSLPKKDEIEEGYVAVNAADERLDAYLPTPTPESVKRLKAISADKRLCNNKQLFDACENDNCEYDHFPISEDLKPALFCLSRSVPCSKRGGCRKATCPYGHVCQKPDCRHRGGKAYCRFPIKVCLADYTAITYVPGNDSPMLSPSMDSEDARNAENGGTNLWY
ncbi:hypothetical protein FALBO_1276 [Fusarium albosuccineum]|uniref:C3H1-type domain-containing protein n=1 Tax=Fusarium albosuccineum TaxID=1237068 RepID=A0A8H4LP80_9HYPO|nr:hypothetical protein FALBO_1276 [Fusarium albosuccineum]